MGDLLGSSVRQTADVAAFDLIGHVGCKSVMSNLNGCLCCVVCDSGSLYTLSFPGSDVSLGDEIWLVVKSSINAGQRVIVSVRSVVAFWNTLLATRAWLQPELQERRLFTVGGGRSVNQVHDRNRSAHDGGVRLEEEKGRRYMLRVRDTASRGPTTIVAPESQFRTCPSDHDSIGYPRMSASGESSTTMHRLLHASGSHPIPTPYDPNDVNRAVDLMESLVVRQTRVQQPTGQSVDPVPSGTSSSQPSVASQSLSLQRFRPRVRQFKRSSSSSSSSGGSNGARPNASFCGQCGGKHKPSQCVGVRGACNNYGQVGHFARVFPTLGQRDLTRSSSWRPYRPFQSKRPGLQPTQVDATTEDRDDVLIGGGSTCSFTLLVNSV
ncbi:hypothetical protein F511_19723 [Dorcoceras hygrometricum]|uniref:Uncharacterized protein n=1 Tax=Dorcoceras hygrometricum TaxID=472368 RepID=A0A2Z7CWK2_9LAMI|nr:hypothetical protein F511_19723 [Dorcoceras hygrometricum]